MRRRFRRFHRRVNAKLTRNSRETRQKRAPVVIKIG